MSGRIIELCNPIASNSTASAQLACRDFFEIAREIDLLNDAEIRDRPQTVCDYAEVSETPGIAPAARDMLAGITSGDTAQLESGVELGIRAPSVRRPTRPDGVIPSSVARVRASEEIPRDRDTRILDPLPATAGAGADRAALADVGVRLESRRVSFRPQRQRREVDLSHSDPSGGAPGGRDRSDDADRL